VNKMCINDEMIDILNSIVEDDESIVCYDQDGIEICGYCLAIGGGTMSTIDHDDDCIYTRAKNILDNMHGDEEER
tara:strand:- start:2742 stop:2966 length:225 start_codon:yes stop_codon:yes gene_type:complete